MLLRLSALARLWIVLTLIVWLADGWLIYGALRQLGPSPDQITREQFCRGEELAFVRGTPVEMLPTDDPYGHCMRSQSVYERSMASRVADRRHAQLMMAEVIGAIALAPLFVAGLFILGKRAVHSRNDLAT